MSGARLFRKGDRVSIMGTVEYNQDEGETVFIRVDPHHSTVWIQPDQVKLVIPRIDPGEAVHREYCGRQGVVMAVSGSLLWVKIQDGSYVTWDAIEVKVIDPIADPLPIAAE